MFHRINPDADGFGIFLEISKIQNYITQSNKEKLEKENEVEIKKLKSKLKKLEAQIKESKIKKIKTQQHTILLIILEKWQWKVDNVNIKNTQSKIKPIMEKDTEQHIVCMWRFCS